MSFIGDIVGGIAKAVLPAVIDSVFPPAALIPGLNNMVANLAGDLLSKGIGDIMKQSGSPLFMIGDAMKLIQQAVGAMQQQTDPAAADQAHSQFGGLVQHTVSDYISDLLSKLKEALGEAKGGKGGKGGSAGTSGTGGTGGGVTLRDLAAALGKLEEEEATRLKGKVDAATKALGTDASAGSSGTSGSNPSSNQFAAMEDVKAESQIQASLSAMVKSVIDNFGEAQKKAAG